MLTGGAVCLVLAAVLAWGAAAGLAVAGLLLIGGELLL